MPKKPNAPILDLTAPPAYQVLRKIGVPSRLPNSSRQIKYPFDQLKVGDGFRIPSTKAKSAGVSARQYGVRHNVTIVVRMDPNHPGKHLVVRSA
jgi:hypothetical protein